MALPCYPAYFQQSSKFIIITSSYFLPYKGPAPDISRLLEKKCVVRPVKTHCLKAIVRVTFKWNEPRANRITALPRARDRMVAPVHGVATDPLLHHGNDDCVDDNNESEHNERLGATASHGDPANGRTPFACKLASRKWNGNTYEELLAITNLYTYTESRRLELRLCHLFMAWFIFLIIFLFSERDLTITFVLLIIIVYLQLLLEPILIFILLSPTLFLSGIESLLK